MNSTPSQHRVGCEVEGKRWTGACECGWRGPKHSSHVPALLDAYEHAVHGNREPVGGGEQ